MCILSPAYVAGEVGQVLEAETFQDGTQSGYWLVQVEGKEIIVALLSHEMKLI